VTSEFNCSWFEPVSSFGRKYCQKVTQFSENIHSVVNFFVKKIRLKDTENWLFFFFFNFFFNKFWVLEGVATFMSTDYSYKSSLK
jgi:hypothetical protein